MARNGSGVYSLPAGSTATDGTTVLATTHNTPLADIEADLNLARPIVAGGTGQGTAEGAFGALVRPYIIGTVAESAGVPTGGIIEAGSGTGGEYVRFADGTQICTHTVTVSLAISVAHLGGYRTSGQTWTYEKVFIDVPRPFVTPISLTGFSGQAANVMADTLSWSVTAISSQTASDRVVVLGAIGRWF